MKNNDTFMNNKNLMDKNRPFMCSVSLMYFFFYLFDDDYINYKCKLLQSDFKIFWYSNN